MSDTQPTTPFETAVLPEEAAAEGVSEAQPDAQARSAPLLAPHIRWAGILWGLVFAATAGVLLWLLADGSRRGAVSVWLLHTPPATVLLVVLLGVGGLLFVAGLASVLRRVGAPRREDSTATRY